ncbi:general stress protein 26 [Virgibacillus natechei]|uniref:General stress protein 26 n=1 Tax=Virgibacillus natechei TaxID=1216297 RepID=A0ABS4IGY5_9BACI|nr:pyridoxamine 5'-phosphate oxidase family protein [Virgibacillus natechei]MBP1970210.1 general stress protein 26 [Virgibacillus natechei]UZD12839.1 pyridoxamine 5'-phosphate oxidase family protein [Virgibacillus natechei]
MSQQEIKATVEEILKSNYVGPMATVKNNKPHSRYMTFFSEGLKLYTLTSKETDKAEETEANPFTHILLGYEGEGFGDEYVEYEGKVSLNNSEELKKELWNDKMKLYFDGPEDPELVLLEINPTAIRVMNKQGEAPKELEF